MRRSTATFDKNVALPLVPFGVRSAVAAELIGVSQSFFLDLVSKKVMPQPRKIGNRSVWDVQELREAFQNLPYEGAPNGVASDDDSGNPWDRER